MVDLPIPASDGDVTLAQAPTNRVSGYQYARSGNYLADGLQKLSTGLEDIATPLAEQQASSDVAKGIVTRNPDGTIQYNSPSSMPIFGDAGVAYNHAVQVGAMAQGQTQVSQDLNAIALEHKGDPQGLATAQQNYLENLKLKLGDNPLGNAMTQEAQKQSGQYSIAAVDDKARLDLASSRSAIDANIADLTSQGTALASAPGGITNPDGTPTQAFQDIKDKLSGYYSNLVANPLFGYPQDKADIDQTNLFATFAAENVVGHIDATYSKQDKASAQALLETSILQNPDLPRAEAARLYGVGMARLQFLDGDTKSAIAGNDKAVTEIENGLHSGALQPDNPAIGFAIEQSKAIRDTAGVNRLNAAVLVARGATPMMGQTDQQRRGFLGVPAPGAPSVAAAPDVNAPFTPDSLAPYKARVAQIENPSGDPNATSSTGATGKYQFEPSTWARYGGGDIHGNQEPAMDKLTLANNAALTSSLGRPPTQAELYLAHQQGAGGAAELLANPTARAGDIVGDAAIKNNGGDPNASAAAFTNLWQAKFNKTPVLPGASALAATGGQQFNQVDVAASPYLLSAYVRTLAADPASRYETAKNLGEGLLRAYSGGLIPRPEDAAQFVQMSQEPAMKGKLSDLADKLQGAYAANSILAMPSQADRDAHVAAIMQAANGADIHTMNIAAYAKDFVDKGNQRMKEAPLTESAQRGIVPQQPFPIEGNPPGALGEIVTQHAKLADRVTAFNGTPTPLLEKRDETELTSMLQGPGGADALKSLSSVDPGTVTKLLAQPSVGQAVAGMAKSGDPTKMAAAYSFIGQQYQTNPMDVEKQFGKDAVAGYLLYKNQLAYLSPDEAMKRVMAWSDPMQAQNREEMRKQADEDLKSLTGDQVASKFSTFSMVNPLTWLGHTAVPPTTGQAATSAPGLRAAYADAYKDQLQRGADKTTADTNALTQLQTLWGVSGVNGNQVMKNPPEYHYPRVDDSHAWISQQLDDDMLNLTGVDKLITTTGPARPTTPGNRLAYINAVSGTFANPGIDDPNMRSAIKMYSAPRSLGSDSTTDADIAAGKPPSYFIAIKGKSGLWTPMMTPSNQVIRFRPDVWKVPGVAATHAGGFTTGANPLMENQDVGLIP